MYLVDTSIWVEIFRNTEIGRASEKKLSETSYFTASVSLAEISKRAYLDNLEPKEFIFRVEKTSNGILNSSRLSEQMAGKMWVEANGAKQRKERAVGLIDCIIAAIAEENDLTVLTKDKHFALFEGIKKEIL